MRSERGAVDGVSALVARPAQVTILTTAHRCPDQYAAGEAVAVAAAFGCSHHPLAGGAEDQIADVGAHESRSTVSCYAAEASARPEAPTPQCANTTQCVRRCAVCGHPVGDPGLGVAAILTGADS